MGGEHAVIFLREPEGVGAALHPPVWPEGFKEFFEQGWIGIGEERGAQTGGRAARFADEGVTQGGFGGSLCRGEGDRDFLNGGGDGGEGVFDEGFVVFKFLLDGGAFSNFDDG